MTPRLPYPYVRACLVCPNCWLDKPRGCYLCWPCHNAQKHFNNGTYSAHCERKIAETDALLGAMRSNMRSPI